MENPGNLIICSYEKEYGWLNKMKKVEGSLSCSLKCPEMENRESSLDILFYSCFVSKFETLTRMLHVQVRKGKTLHSFMQDKK